jgi:hypothetical protein
MTALMGVLSSMGMCLKEDFTTAYSEELDDLQFIFVRQSWFEKCPETDDFGGNYSNAKGF